MPVSMKSGIGGPSSGEDPQSALAVLPLEALPHDLISGITKEQTYNFYGTYSLDHLVETATSWISSISHVSDGEALKRTLQSFLILAECDCQIMSRRKGDDDENAKENTHSCWFTVRMTLPTVEYATPRWHQDGRMFDCSCQRARGVHSKYAVTLIGPSTRVLVTTEKVQEVMRNEYLCHSNDEEAMRKTPAQELEECGAQEVGVQRGQIIRFSWGQDDSPVHSEPDSSGKERVFLSLLFGRSEEIRGMCGFRKKKYGVVTVDG